MPNLLSDRGYGDLCLVRAPHDELNLVLAPGWATKKGDRLEFLDACGQTVLGEVLNLETTSPENPLYQLFAAVTPVFEATRLYRVTWSADEEADDGTA